MLPGRTLSVGGWNREGGISTVGTGGAPVALLPLHSRLAVGGDSITSIEAITGYVPWTQIMGGARWLTRDQNNYAVAGYTTQDFITNRLTNMKNHAAHVNIMLIGTNDIPARITAGDTEAQAIEYTTSRLRTIYTELLTSAVGAKVLAICILPRTVGTWLAAHEAVRLAVNAWIKTQPDIDWVEVETIVAGDLKDGTHPNAIGAREIAAVVAAKLNTYIVQTLVYDDLIANSVNLAPNYDMAGSNAVTEGFVADNWTLTVAAAGVNRVAASKGTLSTGHACQVFTLSGTPSAQALATFNSDTFNVNGLSGERYEAFMAYEIAGVNNTLTHRLYTFAGTNLGGFGSGVSDSATMATGTVSGIMRTKPVALGGSVTTNQLGFSFLMNNSALAGTIKVGRPFVRKVPAGL